MGLLRKGLDRSFDEANDIDSNQWNHALKLTSFDRLWFIFEFPQIF